MNNFVASFYKISFENFKNFLSSINTIENYDIKNIYDNIVIPKRATKFSAGYDFFSPFDFILNPKETILIPTGIRCKMNKDVVLLLFPRSSLGFKYRLQLDNTIGVIDSDYYDSKNEGHIVIKLTNDSNDNILSLKSKEAICQGIFLNYLLAQEEEVVNIRDGGIGSTNEKK